MFKSLKIHFLAWKIRRLQAARRLRVAQRHNFTWLRPYHDARGFTLN